MSTATTAHPATATGADTADHGGGTPKRPRRPLAVLLAAALIGLATGGCSIAGAPAQEPSEATAQAGAQAAAQAAARAEAQEPPGTHAEDLDAGPVVTVDPTRIPLADSRSLTLGLALQLKEGAEQAPDGAKALDLASAAYSGRDVSELADPTIRRAAQEELTKAIKAAYEPEVIDVYLTEFFTE